jgi:glutathionylspermidine synthase
LDQKAFADVRRRLVLDWCKWDPQVGDVATLAPFPLLLSRSAWRQLASDAEALAAETVAAEPYLLRSPSLQRVLGVPWRLRRVLRRAAYEGLPPSPVRVMRFDFHWTREGWRVSEVNSDVPGGHCEASSFTAMMAEQYPAAVPAGDPGGVVAKALARNAEGPVTLVTAPGFMEDQQVTAYLAKRLRELEREAIACGPAQLRWSDGRARVCVGDRVIDVGAVVRFYQAEWLTRLPRATGWENLLVGGCTPVCNPGTSLLTESKRFPLTWDALPTPTDHWRRLLPETRDPRDAPWRDDDGWLLKSAYCNTGDTVAHRGDGDSARWRSAARWAAWSPGSWVAQRRFETVPLDSPIGPVYPCVGVYVVDGRAAGIYGRISPSPVIDYAAIDVAVLVEEEGDDA